ncbi:MAG: FMN-binding negative transcriptional regulator [Streptosporangiales bacterium]|nr:FMN-binding negative transcriptional regulator [Streptosporangiales bacterium]
MYSYPKFTHPGGDAAVRLVRENPFAVLVSSPESGPPVATHLPVIIPAGTDPGESLEGVTLLGHMGRANPHWKMFAERPDVLLVFSSSHGYISPTLYEPGPNAPTLDYAAVHLTGTVEIIEGTAGKLDVVEQTVATLESMRPDQWDPADSRELFAKIVPAITAFRVHVTGEDFMFKLSQNQPEEVRARIRADLREGPHRHPRLADLMDRIEEVR